MIKFKYRTGLWYEFTCICDEPGKVVQFSHYHAIVPACYKHQICNVKRSYNSK